MEESTASFKLRVIKNAKFGRMKEFVNEINRRTGQSKAHIFNDMIHCWRKFGAGYYDYITYHFYDMNDKQRDTYMTRLRNKKFVTQFNDSEYYHCFDNKNEFDNLFKGFISRGFLDVPNATKDEVKRYYDHHSIAFAKMLDLTCGIGAEILKMDDFKDADEFYDYIKKKNFGVIEDYIENHEAIKEIYPYSLNTMRMITLIGDDGEPHLFFAAQKFGVGGRYIDVHGAHGPIDLETGVCNFPFHDGNTETDTLYEYHPDTGKKLVGFKVPYWNESKELVLKAATVVPQMRWIGWDVAVTPDGPIIIEGNNYSAYDYMQLPGQNPSGIGIIPDLLKIVPSYKYK